MFFKLSKYILVLIAFSLIAYNTYYYGLDEIPRGDHGFLVKERLVSPTEWDFLYRTIFFSRLRTLNAGDDFLFRPLMTGTLGLVDFSVGYDYHKVGLVGLSFHVALSFLLFLMAGRLLKSQLAGIIYGLFFLINYAGMEMILWSHIYPYIPALFFSGAGIFLYETGTEKKTKIQGLTSLFIATLFHEIAVVNLLFFIVLKQLFHLIKSRSVKPKQEALFLLIPVILFFVFNFLDSLLHQNGNLLNGFDQKALNTSWSDQISNFFSLFGIFFRITLFPFLVDFDPSGLLGRLGWGFELQNHMEPLFYGGILPFLAVAYLVQKALKQNEMARDSNTNNLLLFYSGGLIVLIVGLSFGRISTRGWSYFFNSAYYNYIGVYYVSFLLVLLFKSYETPLRNLKKRFKKTVTIIAVSFFAYIGIVLVSSYQNIYQTTYPTYTDRRTISFTTLKMANFFRKPGNAPYSFGGGIGVPVPVNDMSLYRYSSLLNREKTPLYATKEKDINILVELKEPEYRSISLDMERDSVTWQDGFYKFKPGHDTVFFKTGQNPIRNFQVSTMGDSWAIYLSYRDQSNWIKVIRDTKKLYIQEMENGSYTEPVLKNNYTIIRDSKLLKLEIRTAKGLQYLFLNGYSIGPVDIKSRISGKIGIQNLSGDPEAFRFSRIELEEDASGSSNAEVYKKTHWFY